MRCALILAGGLGTRLRSVISDVPKPMATVAGKPFLTHILDLLVREHFTHAVLSLGYKSNVVLSHFGTRYGTVDLSYSLEDSPLGTGGAIRSALTICQSDPVFVLNGDTFVDLDCDALSAEWLQCEQPLLVGRYVGDTTRYDALLMQGSAVIGFREKGVGGSGVINAGCYVLPRTLFDRHSLPRTFSFERDFLAHTLKDHPFRVHITSGLFIDIGVPADYFRAQTIFATSEHLGARGPNSERQPDGHRYPTRGS